MVFEFVFVAVTFDMSSVCGGLDFKDAESSSASSLIICSTGVKHISCVGSDDAQESDGDDSGYIHQTVIEESKDKAISEPIPESLPLNSLDDESEDKNLATALQDMFSESVSDPILFHNTGRYLYSCCVFSVLLSFVLSPV